jgi:hypothetical protein
MQLLSSVHDPALMHYSNDGPRIAVERDLI